MGHIAARCDRNYLVRGGGVGGVRRAGLLDSRSRADSLVLGFGLGEAPGRTLQWIVDNIVVRLDIGHVRRGSDVISVLE